MRRYLQLEQRAALSFAIGWANAATIGRCGAFGSLMAGNAALAGQSLQSGRYGDVAFYAAVVACFCVGEAAYRCLEAGVPRSVGRVAAATVVVLCSAQDLWIHLQPEAGQVSMLPLCVSLGVVCAVSHKVGGVTY